VIDLPLRKDRRGVKSGHFRTSVAGSAAGLVMSGLAPFGARLDPTLGVPFRRPATTAIPYLPECRFLAVHAGLIETASLIYLPSAGGRFVSALPDGTFP
jgi:hypothetical protein